MVPEGIDLELDVCTAVRNARNKRYRGAMKTDRYRERVDGFR